MKAKKQFASDPGRDSELMLRVKGGDIEAFEAIYEAYKASLAAFFYHLVWDRSRTEDYIQEVFLRLWKSAGGYQPTGRFSTFLFQIAKNFWLNEREKLKHDPARLSLDATIAGDDGSRFSSQPPSPQATPSTIVARAELKARVQEALESLHEKQRLVFVMSEFQGLKYHEIAEVLDIPIGTVKSRMVQAEKNLRDKLSRFQYR
jgi:RNA polymerase sigma-70 factor (ECF subfamily)